MSDDQFTKLSQDITSLTDKINQNTASISGLDCKLDQNIKNTNDLAMKLDQHANDSNDLILKLYQYMQQEFRSVRVEIAQIRTSTDRVYDLLDADIKRRETDEQERLTIGHKVNRHENWIVQLSTSTAAELQSKPEPV